MRTMTLALAVAAAFAAADVQAAHKWNLKEGTPDLKSAGQLAFGPDGILFVGDTKTGAVFAIDTGDAKAGPPKERTIEKLNEKLASVKGLKDPVAVNDLAVNPDSGNIYLSVTSGGAPALVKIDGEGKLSLVSLANVPFQKATLSNLPEDKPETTPRGTRNRRDEAITDLAYAGGKVLVSGVTAGDAPSRVRELAFPFADGDEGASVEIYHGAHGRLEDNATVRAFIPLTIDGTPSILAGFTCTPLVRFSLESLEPGKKTRGTTVAELGNRNSPLDIISYEKGGERFLLVINTARGTMKVSTKELGRKEGITAKVAETAGQPYETISNLEGAVQLDRLNDEQAVVVLSKNGSLTLKTVALP